MTAADLVGTTPLVELLIVLAGSGGVLGAVVGLVRLSGEKGQVAILQAQGANEVLKDTLASVERERDYWKARYEACSAQLTQITNALGLRDRLDD